jgi:hypothetical protein
LNRLRIGSDFSIGSLRLPRWFTLLLMCALVARAMVPSGFMPSLDRAGTLEFCHAGMTVPDHASPGGGHGGGHVEHCPFGSAPSAGPVASLADPQFHPVPAIACVVALLIVPPAERPARANRSRGPPLPA